VAVAVRGVWRVVRRSRLAITFIVLVALLGCLLFFVRVYLAQLLGGFHVSFMSSFENRIFSKMLARTFVNDFGTRRNIEVPAMFVLYNARDLYSFI